ncbi:MAG: carbonate dehydratase [Gammaproteobacteria bacterium]|jgi:carbonic anhydrase
MYRWKKLLENNKAWSKQMIQANPDFFTTLSNRQKPEYLWIGCADSRVPANEIVGLLPGDVFVHRNIANIVVHTDLNCLSVIQYAVEVLKVRHIIVCGHYGCGGVSAALEPVDHGLIDNWLRHIRDVYRYHQEKFQAITDLKERQDMLCELNVIEQVGNVCHTTIVQNAWRREQELSVHGWCYSLTNGIIKDLKVSVSSVEEAAQNYQSK